MNLQFTTDYRVRLAAAADDEEMSVEEFVFAASELALRPVENRRRNAAQDILELEAMWRSAGQSNERKPDEAGGEIGR